MKRILSLLWGLAAAGVAVADATPTGVVSDPLALDIESGVRSEEVIGALAYDTLWQGVTNADCRILVNGVVLATGSGAGTVAWHPTKYGTYALTYQAFVDNVKVGEDMSATFTLAGKDLVNAEITLAADEMLYDGTARCPKVTIVYLAETLVEGKDYTLEYENNINPGVATMTIRGKGRFSDVLEKNFTIRPAGICSLDIESGTRHAKASELLNYDYVWCGDTNANTRMQIRVNDEILANMECVGSQQWTPTEDGSYVVTLRTYIDDYLQEDKILTAYFDFVGNEPVEITHFTATPRYPWSGKVDVDLTFTGDNRDYAVTLTAKDNNGSTNLPVRTVVGRAVPSAPQSSINEFAFEVDSGGVGHAALPPGTYRLTWDADTDITADADFSRVSMSVKVEEK